MEFAIIRHLGKQHLVTEGAKFSFNASGMNVGDTMDFEDVLLLNTNNNLEIGMPTLSGKKVLAQVVFCGKGEKVRVAKFKAKSRYRKVTGFRENLTIVKVLSLNGKAPEKKTESQSKADKVKSTVAKKTQAKK